MMSGMNKNFKQAAPEKPGTKPVRIYPGIALGLVFIAAALLAAFLMV